MEIHVDSFRSFLNHEFEYVAVLNSRSAETNLALQQMADLLNVVHLSIQVVHSYDASSHHATALNQALHEFLLHPHSPVPLNSHDVLFITDSDIFPMQKTSLLDVMRNASILSMPQSRAGLQYLWPNFLAVRLDDVTMLRDLDFSPVVAQLHGGEQVSLDSGGATYIFLQKYPQLISQWIRSNTECLEEGPLCAFYHSQQRHLPLGNCRTPELLLIPADCSVNCVQFYHLGSAGSNWRKCSEDYLAERRSDLRQYIGLAQQ
jgi:hypothetical protein